MPLRIIKETIRIFANKYQIITIILNSATERETTQVYLDQVGNSYSNSLNSKSLLSNYNINSLHSSEIQTTLREMD